MLVGLNENLRLARPKSVACGAGVLVCWSAVLSFAASVPTITVRSEVSVAGEKVTLGMLLTSANEPVGLTRALHNTIITESPKAGSSKTLESTEIYRRLRALGIEKEEYQIHIPELVKIHRKAQVLTTLDIEDAVKKNFLPTVQWEEVELQRIDIPETIQLPLGQVKLSFECSPHTDFSRPFYLNIGFSVDGRSVSQTFYRTELAIRQTVPVAARQLDSAGQILPMDIRWEKQRLSSTLHAPVKHLSFFEHRRLRQRVPSGKLLTEDLFIPVPMVNRGDRVTLLFEQAKLRITAPGKSLGSGSKGERIRVVNLDSKRELIAEILDERTVRVGL